MKIKTRDVLEDTNVESRYYTFSLKNIERIRHVKFIFLAVSGPVSKTTEDEQEFRDRVERVRRLGGDAWLGLLNEIQNEYKVQLVAY